MRKLTAKQAKFIDEFMVDLNATQAAIRAGYSPKTAKEIASENLSKPNIAAAIQAKQAELRKKLDISQERVLQEIARCAFLDPADLYDAAGSLLPLSEMSEDTRRAIAGLESADLLDGQGDERTRVGMLKKIKLTDKLAALEKLCKHLGLFEKDNQQRSLKLCEMADEELEKIANCGK